MTYNLGDLARCTGTFANSAGTAIDPAAVFFETIAPDGVRTSYTYGTDAEVVKSSTGVYYVDVDCNQSGVWEYRMYGTGTGQAADNQSFFVKPTTFET